MALGSCAVKHCNNKGSYEHKANFFRIPKDISRAVKWLRHCREGTSLKYGRICWRHFKSSDYKSTNKARPYLKNDAVPTQNIDYNDDDDDEDDGKDFLNMVVDEETMIDQDRGDIKDNSLVGDSCQETATKPVLSPTKLLNVLYNTGYCGICLELDNEASDMDTMVYLQNEYSNVECSLSNLVNAAFGEKISECLSSNYICSKCTETTIAAFLMISKAKSMSLKLNNYVQELQLKIDDTLEKVEENDLTDNVIITIDGDNCKFEDINIQNVKEDPENTDSEEMLYICDYCLKVHLNEQSLIDHLETHNPEIVNKTETKDINKERNKLSLCLECEKSKCIHEKYIKWFLKQQKEGRKHIKCMKCNYFTKKKHLFIEHINKAHISNSYSCNECQEILYSKRSLITHMRNYHNDCVCQYCDGLFKNDTALREHLQDCVLTIRPLNFDEVDDVIVHEKKRHKCDVRDYESETEIGLRGHKNTIHVNKTKDITHTDDYNFDSNKDLKRDLLHKCQYCDKTFKSMKFWRHHERSHRKDCQICDNCDEIGDECRCTKTQFLCDTCGKEFTSRSALNTHFKDHLALIKCSFCNKSLKASSMKSHLWRHKVLKDPNFLYKQRFNKRRFHCDTCNYVSSSANYMESHINRFHLKIKPYKCEVCAKDFAGHHLRDIHMEVHNKSVFYKCQMCDKTFGRQLGLTLHIRSAHTGEKPFYCEICGDSFISTSLLSRHKKKAHLNVSVQCPICDSKLASISETRKHIKRMHWNGVGVFDLNNIEELTEDDREMLEDRRRSSFYFRGQPV